MSEKSLPPELLSAYFDDEVSTEVRAQIKLATDQTPAVNQVLADYRHLSETLRLLKDEVPSPGLRDAVMAGIRPEAVPLTAGATSKVPARRSRWRIAGAGMTAAAAGLLLMLWPAGPQERQQADVAVMPAVESAEASGALLADRVELGASASTLSDRESSTNGLLTEDSPALAEHDAERVEESPVRVASLPVESLLEQVAKNRSVPKPGDVVRYLAEVADETVWIPLTVVDVQMAAGEIRVLLANHGIVSPVDADAIGSSASDTSVVILVESDWEKVAEVVADLDSHGYGQPEDVATSLAMQKVQIEQKLQEPVLKRQRFKEGLAAAVPGAAGQAEANRPAAESARGEEGPATSRSPSRPLHAQLAARVSDKDVHEFELRGRSIFAETSESTESSPGLAADETQDSPSTEPAEPVPADRFSDISASPSPARVVFLIKKSK